MIFGIKDNHKGILYDYIKPNKSEVFIYYSGHGAPDINSNRAYFVPKNGNPDKEHGLFTYFFLEAVSGGADRDMNRKITFKETYDFVADNAEGVPYWAKRLHGGRVQIPTLQVVNDLEVFSS